jgi:hypothetical protein
MSKSFTDLFGTQALSRLPAFTGHTRNIDIAVGRLQAREQATALGLTPEEFTHVFSEVNYSSARGAPSSDKAQEA